MPLGFRIHVNIEEARMILNRMIEFSGNPIPAHREIAGYMVAEMARHIRRKQDEDGIPWKPLHRKTIKEKREAGLSLEPLVRSGMLLGSFSSNVSKDQVEVGTPMEYAPPQQFGSSAAARMIAGSTLKHVPIRSVREQKTTFTQHKVPPRPFVYMTMGEEATIMDIYKKHLERASKGERPIGGWQ